MKIFVIPQGESFFFRVFAVNPAGKGTPAELSSPVALKIKKGNLFSQCNLWLYVK